MWRLFQPSSSFSISPYLTVWAQCGPSEHEPSLFYVFHLHREVCNHYLNVNMLHTAVLFLHICYPFKIFTLWIYSFFKFFLITILSISRDLWCFFMLKGNVPQRLGHNVWSSHIVPIVLVARLLQSVGFSFQARSTQGLKEDHLILEPLAKYCLGARAWVGAHAVY